MLNKNKKILILAAFLVSISSVSFILVKLLSNDHNDSHLEKTKKNIILPYTDSNVIALGKKIYLQHCASCHGTNLEGQSHWQTRDTFGYLPAPPHNENGHLWHHDNTVLFDTIKYGVAKFSPHGYKTRMSSYSNILSDDEIIAVLSFIKSTWPDHIKSKHDLVNLKNINSRP